MNSIKHALGTVMLCVASLAVHVPVQAAQWRVVSATVAQLTAGEWAPDAPLLHAVLPNGGAPFMDGVSPDTWDNATWGDYAVWGEAEPSRLGYWSQWRLGFSPELGDAPSIDLVNMQAHFESAALMNVYGVYEGKTGWYVGAWQAATLGLPEGVAITEVAAGRYTANWSVRSTGGGGEPAQGNPANPLYSVSLTFIAHPEGTPWSYAPVPEPSSGFMALAGLGAVGWARRRQVSRLAA